jgi:hypothetical protein
MDSNWGTVALGPHVGAPPFSPVRTGMRPWSPRPGRADQTLPVGWALPPCSSTWHD